MTISVYMQKEMGKGFVQQNMKPSFLVVNAF